MFLRVRRPLVDAAVRDVSPSAEVYVDVPAPVITRGSGVVVPPMVIDCGSVNAIGIAPRLSQFVALIGGCSTTAGQRWVIPSAARMDAWNEDKPFQDSPNPKGFAPLLTLVSVTRIRGEGITAPAPCRGVPV